MVSYVIVKLMYSHMPVFLSVASYLAILSQQINLTVKEWNSDELESCYFCIENLEFQISKICTYLATECDTEGYTDFRLTVSDIDEGIKGKLFHRLQLTAIKAFIEDGMLSDISREWAESAAKDLEEHKEKK